MSNPKETASAKQPGLSIDPKYILRITGVDGLVGDYLGANVGRFTVLDHRYAGDTPFQIYSNGIGMGLSVTIILTLSNIFISLLRRIIPEQVRIACYIVVIAGFVTMVDLLLQAFFPDIAESLGVFIPLIVVNCIILARAMYCIRAMRQPSVRKPPTGRASILAAYSAGKIREPFRVPAPKSSRMALMASRIMV